MCGQDHMVPEIRFDGKFEIIEPLYANFVKISGTIFCWGIEPDRNRDRGDSNASGGYCQRPSVHVFRLTLALPFVNPPNSR